MASAVIKLPQKAADRSAFVIHCELYDEAGAAMTPNSIRWGNYTLAGDVVNSKSAVSITAADSFNIVLNGSDTAITTAGDTKRRVLIECSYNSATYGNNLVLNREVEYEIEDLPNIS